MGWRVASVNTIRHPVKGEEYRRMLKIYKRPVNIQGQFKKNLKFSVIFPLQGIAYLFFFVYLSMFLGK
jgi:hypothetical protein